MHIGAHDDVYRKQHWHGLFQHHSNQMDGMSFVTQCPIAPGHSFLYDFNATDQVGTYWYHSHYGVRASIFIHGVGN
jgi:FtsP/CotA-like multicopper oxidase with cupredoxin domain